MQLVRLKLLSDFRSLPSGFEIRFSQEPVPERIDQLISPICFVGKNGTGKSNTLELICEIFFYLDSLLLDYPSDTLLSKKQFGFELEYKLSIDQSQEVENLDFRNNSAWPGEFRHIKVVKEPAEGEPIYYLIDANHIQTAVQRIGDTKREIKDRVKLLLPSKIVGYSSGLNELISTPFIKMKFHYLHEYQKRLEEYILDGFEEGRLFYMNYESNAAIVISNFLLQDKEKLDVFDETLEIFDIDSFRIVIEEGNFVQINSNARASDEKIDITAYFAKEIQFLKQIATSQKENTFTTVSTAEEKKVTILDFKVSSATKDAFRHFFGDAYSLYSTLYRMLLLNTFKIPIEIRNKIRDSVSGINILDLLPALAHDQLLFRIEKIILIKSKTRKVIRYKNISDGEHQFIHIVGTCMIMNQNKTLFILDEPETHFNPKWRSKFVNTINKVERAEMVICQKNNKIREKYPVEIVLTTHSPFILSDSYRNKVWKFIKTDGQLNYDIIKIKTYGTSFSVLLEDAFDKEETISEMPLEFIESLKKDIVSLADIENARSQLKLLGESTEKIFLLNYLAEKEKEFSTLR